MPQVWLSPGCSGGMPRSRYRLPLARQLSLIRLHPKYSVTLCSDAPATIWSIGSRAVILPVEAHYLAVRGLADALRMVEDARSINPNLTINGVLITKVNALTNVHKTYIELVRRHAPELVYPFMVPLHVAHQEAASAGKPIITYYPQHPGSQVYKQLAETLA